MAARGNPTANQVLNALYDRGFRHRGGKGSHVKMVKEGAGGKTTSTVPFHGGKTTVGPDVLEKIARKLDLTQSEFRDEALDQPNRKKWDQ